MKKICIFGAGGFAKEVFHLINQELRESFNVVAFVDKNPSKKYMMVPIEDKSFFDSKKHSAVIGMADSKIRATVLMNLEYHTGKYEVIDFPIIISTSVKAMRRNIDVGRGSIICTGSILTCDIRLGEFAQLNLGTTIGHDTEIGDFFTSAPGVHISGKVKIGNHVYFGTNSSTVEEISICDNVIVGAGACVVKNITEPGTYVGVPARKIK